MYCYDMCWISCHIFSGSEIPTEVVEGEEERVAEAVNAFIQDRVGRGESPDPEEIVAVAKTAREAATKDRDNTGNT